MLAFEDFPLEVAVTDLVLAESLLQLLGQDVLGAKVPGA
jgi:hypothetical protein